MSPSKPRHPHPPADPIFGAVLPALKAHAVVQKGQLGKRLALARSGKIRPVPFTPWLLIRSRAGDNGQRAAPGSSAPEAPALGTPCSSPDIWLRYGLPSDPQNPELPPSPHAGDLPAATVRWPDRPYCLRANQPHSAYAHVWNLGLAPAGRARVEFSWVPDVHATATKINPVIFGVELVDLMPRGAPGYHKLVKCSRPFTPPVIAPLGAIIVRVSTLGDPASEDHQWEPGLDRHVAAHAAGTFLHVIGSTVPPQP